MDIRDPDLRSWLRFVRVLRVSPSGELVAATADEDGTGIVDSDELLRVADNRLRAWSGNYGIMTFGLADGAPSAALYPVDSRSPPRVIASARKVSIHADLGGEWFAHNVGRGRPRLIWRNPDGSVLSITEFGFRPSRSRRQHRWRRSGSRGCPLATSSSLFSRSFQRGVNWHFARAI